MCALFQRENPIFDNEIPLRDGYEPDHLQAREDELDKYRRALMPIIRGAPPKNIFLYGEPGVGKTAATKYILGHLKDDAKDYDDIDISVVYLSCNGYNSSYKVAIGIINKIREMRGETDSQLPTTGYSRPDVFRMMFDELKELGGTVLLVLDEIDNIGDDHDILYELPRAHSSERLSMDEAQPGIIGISNDPGFLNSLEPAVEDTLMEEVIRFNVYKATELEAILEPRAKIAFQDGVLESDVVPLCAAMTAQETGSARQARRILYTAGELAEEVSDEKITTKHVRNAQQILQEDYLKESLRELTVQGHLALLTVMDATSRGDNRARMKDLYDPYCEFAVQAGHRDLASDRMRSRLNMLYQQNILNRYEETSNGRWFEYELEAPFDTVLAVLAEIPEFEGIVQSIAKRSIHSGLIDREQLHNLKNTSTAETIAD